MTFDVSASDIEAVVAVYEGEALADLRAPPSVVETAADSTRVTFTAVAGGSYHVAVVAQRGGAAPAPAIVVSGGGHVASVSVTRDDRKPTVPAPIGLSIDRVYVNQAVPTHDSSRPSHERIALVANRAGLLRVFATADDVGANAAQVWFHYRHGAGPEHVTQLDGPESVPTSSSEGSMSTTYDVLLPAHVPQPGRQGYVALRASVAGETVEVRYPATGTWTFDVGSVAPVDMTLVPVSYRITDLYVSDLEGRHHDALVDPGYLPGIAGIARIGHPIAVGWSHLPSGSLRRRTRAGAQLGARARAL